MSDESPVMQLVTDLLVAAGFTEDVDRYAQAFLVTIYQRGFSLYIDSLAPAKAAVVLAEIETKTHDAQKMAFMVRILAEDGNQPFLAQAAEQVAHEFSAIVNQAE